MIQPTSKLPWKEKLSRDKKRYEIRSADSKIVINNIEQSLADAMYIEEACNNYQKAIELLQESMVEAERLQTQGYSNSASVDMKIKKFLKQIDAL